MKNNQPKTNHDIVVELLTKTIPYFTSDHEWRNVFDGLANLSEEERSGMLQRLDTVTGPQPLGLENDEHLPVAMEFLRLSLEEPLNPCMMVKMIDESIRIQKILFDRIGEPLINLAKNPVQKGAAVNE